MVVFIQFFMDKIKVEKFYQNKIMIQIQLYYKNKI